MELILLILISCCVGAMFGSYKSRVVAGAVLGFLLGPLGWVIILILPEGRDKCDECKGPVNRGATRCVNCGCVLKT